MELSYDGAGGFEAKPKRRGGRKKKETPTARPVYEAAVADGSYPYPIPKDVNTETPQMVWYFTELPKVYSLKEWKKRAKKLGVPGGEGIHPDVVSVEVTRDKYGFVVKTESGAKETSGTLPHMWFPDVIGRYWKVQPTGKGFEVDIVPRES